MHDRLLGESVICRFGRDDLAKALAATDKRVAVSGRIQYTSGRAPLRIGVEHIDIMQDDADRPSLDDVRGILSAAGSVAS